MKLELIRDTFTPRSTTGMLGINGVFQCYVLEDTVRAIKVQNETAIPEGSYKLVPHYSPHLKRVVPMLADVPGFSLVYIHWGNKPEDTDGCLLTGSERGLDIAIGSRVAFESLYAKIAKAWKTEEVWLSISNATGNRGVATAKKLSEVTQKRT